MLIWETCGEKRKHGGVGVAVEDLDGDEEGGFSHSVTSFFLFGGKKGGTGWQPPPPPLGEATGGKGGHPVAC